MTSMQDGYAALPAEQVAARLGPLSHDLDWVLSTFAELVEDRFMNDGGRYRFRRYSRFLWEDRRLTPLLGNSILQSVEENSLNGGVLRTFEPLSEPLANSPFLAGLIAHDAALARTWDPKLFEQPVQVGVHQVRIVALPERSGLPTPEGVHLDGERFTFQHLMGRRDIEGGEFTAYDAEKKPVFRWLQEKPLDSVAFEGTTWHSASPVKCRPGAQKGHRDIFLIDFDALAP